MRRMFSGVGAVAGLLTMVALPAAALPVTTLLSAMSSEQEEVPGTPASALNAAITVELSGTSLKITIDNNTSGGPGAGDYDISEIWLNIIGETVVSVTPAGSGSGASSLGYDLLAPPPAMVDGFGNFSTGLGVHGDVNQNPDLITAGEQDVMVFLACLDGDCSDAMLVDNAMSKAVAAKFVNGGDAYGDPNDSAYGASPAAYVPEPATVAMLAMGLVGLGYARRRGR